MKKRRKSRSKNGKPKGSYPLPSGAYVSVGKVIAGPNGHRIRVRAVHRAEPDLRMLAHAFIEMTEAGPPAKGVDVDSNRKKRL